MDQQNKHGESALFSACRNGHEAGVRQLVLSDADPGLADSFGTTPLMAGAEAGAEQVVRYLLRFERARLDATRADGMVRYLAPHISRRMVKKDPVAWASHIAVQ